MGRGVSGEPRGHDRIGLAARGARRSWEQGKSSRMTGRGETVGT